VRIFHIATAADWAEAQVTGSYTTSTRGRTLAQEGFIHASRGDQWQGVRERYYADVGEPLVLLSIDPDLLGSPVVEEAVPGTDETFPHVYGPIDIGAVLTVLPLDDEGPDSPGPAPAAPASVATTDAGSPADATRSFSSLFLEEVFKQLGLASLVLACVVALTVVGLSTGAEWGPVSGAGLGLVLGVLAARTLSRRRG
jgi:uncharacterized protein (DUF952 family)